MIVAAACVPQAPLLLPGLTGGTVAEVEEIRTHVEQAVDLVVELAADQVIVIGAAPTTAPYPADAPAPAGRLAPATSRRPRPDALPVPLAVGRSALAGRPLPYVLEGIEESAPPGRCRALGRRLAIRPGRVGLLVVADGTARRGEKAPGYLDPRATELDEQVARALDTADTAALLALEPGPCADQLMGGRAAWQVLAGACQGTSWSTRRMYEGDPFGVAYHVVVWHPEGRRRR